MNRVLDGLDVPLTEVNFRVRGRQLRISLSCTQGHRAESAVNLDRPINQRVREFWSVGCGNHCEMSEFETVAASQKQNARRFERRAGSTDCVENPAIPEVFTSASKTPGDRSLGVSR
jgi:hypothetical protein